MKLRHGFKAEAERIAIRVRSQLELGPLDPLDPWAACEHFDLEVVRLRDLLDPGGNRAGQHFLTVEPDVFSGCVVSRGFATIIVYNDRHHVARQRSDLAHELAHCFLGHPIGAAFDLDGERMHDKVVEEEAKVLGAALLVTKEAAFHVAEIGMDLVAAAKHFGVSGLMLDYRLKVTGALVRAERRAQKS